ncbi:hypothetical protein HNP84_002677 [Thermocatellispora tengchongensis]|uniref:Uncharacterized protein n=1 Tax=Thermocatellispora tengchongensis TaxID=1073253 RepID=A0A840P387_9ACTN|nr:hypothetical protein [Thermocatellispora tengchongensis]MBB5132956.1 hypothetical protein [Thermocatellispora tengchongensis]
MTGPATPEGEFATCGQNPVSGAPSETTLEAARHQARRVVAVTAALKARRADADPCRASATGMPRGSPGGDGIPLARLHMKVRPVTRPGGFRRRPPGSQAAEPVVTDPA